MGLILSKNGLIYIGIERKKPGRSATHKVTAFDEWVCEAIYGNRLLRCFLKLILSIH